MDTTAGGSGDDDGRGNYRFSTGKGKTQVSPQLKPKTQGGLERAMVWYLQRWHENVVAAGEKPPFGGHYSPPPDLGQATPPPDTNNTPKHA